MSDTTPRPREDRHLPEIDRMLVETVFCDERGAEARRFSRPLRALLAPLRAPLRTGRASAAI